MDKLTIRARSSETIDNIRSQYLRGLQAEIFEIDSMKYFVGLDRKGRYCSFNNLYLRPFWSSPTIFSFAVDIR